MDRGHDLLQRRRTHLHASPPPTAVSTPPMSRSPPSSADATTLPRFGLLPTSTLPVSVNMAQSRSIVAAFEALVTRSATVPLRQSSLLLAIYSAGCNGTNSSPLTRCSLDVQNEPWSQPGCDDQNEASPSSRRVADPFDTDGVDADESRPSTVR
uniref:Uncharacterized protein n=1 Tax=Ananas comosus var. bracteatus TaxID=296719 RepID=A0A6V7Q6K0_ANACO|nr:unnamed protein product [Ananas comosus var. bracteatus]CAD1838714.1 unnamed protein product [Ananas comosus var. bracteatus]